MLPSVATSKVQPLRKPTAASATSLINGQSIGNQTTSLSGGTLDSSMLTAPAMAPRASTIIAPAAPIVPVVATTAPAVSTAPQVAAPSLPSMPIPDASLFSQPVIRPYTGVNAADYSATKLEGQVNQPCLTCQAQQRLERIPLPKVRPKHLAAQQLLESTADKSLLDRLSDATVHAATKGRPVAPMCRKAYGETWREGNRSKCWCATGVKEALLATGICTSRPGGNAVDMQYTIGSSCPSLHKTGGHGASPESAPFGSVIVYHTTRHSAGHVETKIQVTAANIMKYMAETGRQLRVGQALYCSDFCSTVPTRSYRMDKYGRTVPTNFVDAIFSL